MSVEVKFYYIFTFVDVLVNLVVLKLKTVGM